MRVTSSDGVDIELHDLGGAGPPLLISHATGFLAAVYKPLATALADRFHVWAVDYRGHGDSAARGDGNQCWSGMTLDLFACLDALAALGVDEPLVGFGHSMGGAVLLDAARSRPCAFRSLAVFEPIVPPVGDATAMPPGDNDMAGPARRRRATFANRSEALARYAGRPPLNEMRADVLWHYVEEGFRDLDDGSVTLKCTPESEAATFEGVVPLTSDELAAVTSPVLVMLGARQREFSPARFAPATARQLAGGELVEYPTLGHFGPFQDPLRIALDVISFADRP